MKLKNPIFISLILPLLLAIILGIIKRLNDPVFFWDDYLFIPLLFIFWLATGFVGVFLSYLTDRKRLQLIVPIVLQTVLIIGFASSFYFEKEPVIVDKDEKMKNNRSMVYDETLYDSLAKFPNAIKIAYQKLESSFPNPNDFKLLYFGVEKADSLSQTRNVYFSYKLHDTLELYSKIQVLNDTGYMSKFNQSINDTEYVNSKKRVKFWGRRE